jgi:hypothetical protein
MRDSQDREGSISFRTFAVIAVANHSGDCRPCMGEHYARSQQSRTKRNTGINDARSDSTASRRYLGIDHRDGALTASYQNLAGLCALPGAAPA